MNRKTCRADRLNDIREKLRRNGQNTDHIDEVIQKSIREGK